MSAKTRTGSGGTKKYGRNKEKCQRYRMLVGKPLGRGVPGNKAGKNHVLIPTPIH